MGIGIYTTATIDTVLSTEEDFTNPLLVAMNGKTGGIIQRRLYLHNNDITLAYSGLTIRPTNPINASTIDGSIGFSWKLYPGDIQPTEEQWASVNHSNMIQMSGVGTHLVSDTTTFLPFWNRIEVPRNVSVQTIKDIKLTVSGVEILVGA